MAVREIDGKTLQRARMIFNEYKTRGIIVEGAFDDMAWTLTNQVRKVRLSLVAFEGGHQKKAMDWIGCSYRQYVECVKAYLVFNLGELDLATLQDLAQAFNKLAMSSEHEDVSGSDYLRHIIALLQIIPEGNEQRDGVIVELEERAATAKWKKRNGSQRQLADFKSYLRFHDILQDFWQGASKKQKLFYFPVYMWWNLTAVLPLRPMEFLLTPRECIRNRDSENILTVRRTKLKGGLEKIGYQIAKDYEFKEYAIHENLAAELQWYIRATKDMKRTKLDTLFLQAPHFSYFNLPVRSTSQYYTYACINTCLRAFYDEIAGAGNGDISRINLGDTRHLAMTNLIISGGSPVICRELAGHSKIDVSANYYSNISNLVECVTLAMFRKSKNAAAAIVGAPKYPISIADDMRRVTDGWCASVAMKSGDVDDCLKMMGDNGHIGDCRRCGHYRPDNPGIRLEFYDENTGKGQVDADSRHLIRMIELVRRGAGHEEDIASALLRLQRSSDHYGKCLWEKYTMKGQS